jgi:ribosomal protein L18
LVLASQLQLRGSTYLHAEIKLCVEGLNIDVEEKKKAEKNNVAAKKIGKKLGNSLDKVNIEKNVCELYITLLCYLSCAIVQAHCGPATTNPTNFLV